MKTQLKRLLANVVPMSVKLHIRSLMYCRQIGMLRAYGRTLSNSSKVQRLGNDYGGWNIPKQGLDTQSNCYCVGCGEDISFDLALIDRFGCVVHGVDPTPRSIDFVRKETANESRYQLHEIALWSETGELEFFEPLDSSHVSYSLTNLQNTTQSIKVPTQRLSELMASLKHDKISLLKLDVEGAETVIIDTVLEDDIDVDVLCVEFDEFLYPTVARLAGIKATVQKLTDAGYTLFWIESSNFTFVKS